MPKNPERKNGENQDTKTGLYSLPLEEKLALERVF